MTPEELKELNNLNERIVKERQFLKYLSEKISKPTFPEERISINIDGFYIENKFNDEELERLLFFLQRFCIRKRAELSELENNFEGIKIKP